MTTGRADKTRVTGDKEAACLRSGDTGRCHTLSGAASRDRLTEVLKFQTQEPSVHKKRYL